MAGQPVKRGNWGDWATIEHTPRSEKRCCGGCIHYCYEDDSCKVRPIVVYEVGADFWRTCPKYRYNIDAVLKSPYIPQHPPADDSSKKQIRYKPNPAITLGMDVIDENNRVGKITRLSYENKQVDVQYPSRIITYQFPESFIQHRLKKYYKSSGESIIIDYFQQVNVSDDNFVSLKNNSNSMTDDVLVMTKLAILKRASELKITDFLPGMLVFHRQLGVGRVHDLLLFQELLIIDFSNGCQRKFHVPTAFIAGKLVLLENNAIFSPEDSRSCTAKSLSLITPSKLRANDFTVGMKIFDLWDGIGRIIGVNSQKNFLLLEFNDKHTKKVHVPLDFVSGFAKVVVPNAELTSPQVPHKLVESALAKSPKELTASDFVLGMTIIDSLYGAGRIYNISTTGDRIYLSFADNLVGNYNIPISFVIGRLKFFTNSTSLSDEEIIQIYSNISSMKTPRTLCSCDFVPNMKIIDSTHSIGQIEYIDRETLVVKFPNEYKKYRIPNDFSNGTIRIFVK